MGGGVKAGGRGGQPLLKIEVMAATRNMTRGNATLRIRGVLNACPDMRYETPRKSLCLN